MHIYFEQLERPASFSDCKIVSLSWMGRVSDAFLQSWNDDQQQENWKFNHVKYYEEGWLATGNQRGICGITYTSCKCPSKLNKLSMPFRTNYNLRGHRYEIKFVKWNEPFQKLATVDTNGTIFVWIKDNRWSIELINDREVQVVDFNWSHDGRMALITYLDGFILIGSVAGQRYWSSLLNLESNQMTTGIWSPDDRQVLIGVSNGSFLVLNLNGAILAEFMLLENVPVCKMAWSCEKFKLDEDQAPDETLNDNLNNVINLNTANNYPNQSNPEFRVNSPVASRAFADDTFDTTTANKDESISNCFKSNYKSHVLAICFEDGFVYLLKSYDDPFPVKINTKLVGIQLEWSNKGEILAVAGHLFNMVKSNLRSKQPYYMNVIKFYASSNGHLRYVVNLNYTLSPITAITWGHNDRRLFVATGNCIHIAWITKKMPKLQLLSRLAIKQFINKEQDIKLLQLPASLRILIRGLFIRTLRCHLPDLNNLRDFVVNAPPANMRYYCTLIRHVPKDRDARSKLFSTYVLYLEYLGGLIPILKGKRTSKLKPEFIIYDPQPPNSSSNKNGVKEIFENYFNRRSSTRRIAYYVPNSSVNNSNYHQMNHPMSQKAANKKITSYLTNSNASTSESEDNEESFCRSEQSNCAIETLPSNFYQSFLKRKLCRKKANNDLTNHEESNSLISNSNDLANDLNSNELTNNQLTNQLNNQLNNSSSNLNNQEQNQETDNTSSPFVLTLLGHNPIIFTRRRAINSSNQLNLSKKLTYTDEMPETKKFLLITSNIWGTRFKFIGLTSWLPSSIGGISYKTSLLHLQPRQMQIQIKEMIFNQNSSETIQASENSLKDKITENVLKSCESDSNFNNLDEDFEWNNTSFEDDEYIKTIPVAPLSPQFLNVSNASNKLNSPMEFSSMDDYLTFQIDPSTEQINCNLTFSSDQSNHHLNYSSLNEFCNRHQNYKDDGHHLNFLHSLQPKTTLTNSVSTQTSFPSLNNLNNQSESLLNNEENDEFNTMNTLASCSRLIHSSSMICPGKNANQFKNYTTADKDGFTKRLINRKSLDLSLQRRLTLENTRRPLSCYSLKLDNKTKCILNCMYLDNEEELIKQDKNDDLNEDEFSFDSTIDRDLDKDLYLNEKKLLNQINQIHSSNESLLESYCFDDQSSNRMMKENSDLDFTKCYSSANQIPPGTPVHKRKLSASTNRTDNAELLSNNYTNKYKMNNLTDRMKDLNNNNQKKILVKKLDKKPFYSNDSFDSDEIQVISNNVINSRLSNSTSDLLIAQSELNEERRKNELNDHLSIRSDNFNANDQRRQCVNNSRLSFINRSLPATPLKSSSNKNRKRSLGKTLLYSPIMIRKAMKQKFNYLDCSSDDDRLSDDDAPYSRNSNNLQSNQTKLKQSVKQSFCLAKRHSLNKVQPNSDDRTYSLNNSSLKELIMHNKAPVWNELSQVYQLDFGGRVTQESAKNFQIEFQNKQVLQFGRIDVNAYTLDFQQPFSGLQALSVSLANVTQRLK